LVPDSDDVDFDTYYIKIHYNFNMTVDLVQESDTDDDDDMYNLAELVEEYKDMIELENENEV